MESFRKKRRSVLRRPVVLMAFLISILSCSMISIIVRMEKRLRREKHSIHPQLRQFSNRPLPAAVSGGKSDARTTNTILKKPFTKKQEKKLKAKNNDDGSNNTNTNKEILEIYKTFDDPPVIRPPIMHQNVIDFDPNIEGVVVVTKIQGPPHLRALRQMLCLFTKAYNNRAHRNIVVFTSEFIEANDVKELQDIAAPAKLVVEIDNPGLHEMISKFTPQQQTELVKRCHVHTIQELTWYSKCDEERTYITLKNERLAYTWQAEFRALHLWTHPALESYRYMMWMDSDAFCTRTWNQDPLAAMIRYDLVLLFDHFPQGMARGSEFPAITREAFQRDICAISMMNGTLEARDGRCYGKKKSKIHQVHGFFHVTDLDFYRSEPVMKWNKALIGDGHFSRLFDDQIGITMPAAVLAGNRSWDMKTLGIYPRVFHNYVIDGLMSDWRGYFVPWWEKNANTTFPEASNDCLVDISG
ncbi:hypothetical protein IV203_016742 [Nitzschia inconspicua]|uniref:Uncharacterized protein n=1 Tax=Nitzschia inconspicua TaxID=303405 RepID=A0A9K3KRA0_9STRA|nr:hypothetical protein IV203_016742 [Nitzschia inconspicua]